jgi:hypothetical protein
VSVVSFATITLYVASERVFIVVVVVVVVDDVVVVVVYFVVDSVRIPSYVYIRTFLVSVKYQHGGKMKPVHEYRATASLQSTEFLHHNRKTKLQFGHEDRRRVRLELVKILSRSFSI